MKKEDPILIFCTTDQETRPVWVDALLERKLIACATRISNCESIYWWQGKLETAKESLWILKTFQLHFEEIVRTIENFHHYSTPEILSIQISAAEKYLTWMVETVQ
ncbi:MAG: divalent-cation tolerance protein CutA [bacterium]|nr:divalent-cation tolerance protein CutA [bacterium]